MDKNIQGPKDRIRVALFGAGKMALHHLTAIQLLENVVVTGIADPVTGRRHLGGQVPDDLDFFSKPEDLLRETKPDVVHVCTPPETHASLAQLALNNGAHVYVEKPFALVVEEARSILSLAEKKGLRVCAGHQLLFEAPAKRAVESVKKIGRLVHVESYFSFRPVRKSKDGRTAISSIDQLIDIFPHPVYLLLHFLRLGTRDEETTPVEILSLEANPKGNIHGILRSGNVTGSLVVTLEGRPVESYVKVVGTNGSLLSDFVRGTVITLPGPGTSGISKVINPYSQSWQTISETTIALSNRLFRKQKSYPGLAEIIRAFYESFPKGKVDVINGTSIIETVSICEEAGKKLRRAVTLENTKSEIELQSVEANLPVPDKNRGGVLVTGGTGLLGRQVVCELRERGWWTLALGRKVPPPAVRVPGVEYLAIDLGGEINPEILKGISMVVHCAAETSGGKDSHARNSLDATRNLLMAMESAGVKRIVHISSIAVLQSSREMGAPVDESTPLIVNPEERGPYVWGKTESERLAREMCARYGIEIRIIRPGPLVDYRDFEAPGRLGREVGRYFVFIGSKNERLSLCNVQTASQVIRSYVEHFETMPEILNLVEPVTFTRGELVSRLLGGRPDLKAVRFPSSILWLISSLVKLLHKVSRPGIKPLDIYSAFTAEKYKVDLAAKVIQFAGRPKEDREAIVNESRESAP